MAIVGRPVRHQLQGLVLDDEAVAGVVVGVARIRGLEVAVDAIAIGDPEHRLEQAAAEALALDGGIEPALRFPTVHDRLRQSRNAKIGLVLLVVGFGLRIVAAWP
jgi:hypothetical protein